MSSRSREMVKKIVKKLRAEKSLTPTVKDQIQKFESDPRMVMGQAHRGFFAGRHIQFGNRVSETGGNKSRRSWKPNVQDKKLFSYALDHQIRVKVTTHALRSIDKAGGLDEYLLKTPYHKMESEMGMYWKAKIEKMYDELGRMEISFFSPEEANLDDQFMGSKTEQRAAYREGRRRIFGWSGKPKATDEVRGNADTINHEDEIHEGGSDADIQEHRVAHA